MHIASSFALVSVTLLSGCAGLKFNDGPETGAMTYFESVPYFFVSTTPECVTTATVVAIPGQKRSVAFERGYGSSSLSLTLDKGMITTAGQTTDTKISETIAALAAYRTATTAPNVAGEGDQEKTGVECIPEAHLYPISESGVNQQAPIPFPVKVKD